jgi:hypothetical protein
MSARKTDATPKGRSASRKRCPASIWADDEFEILGIASAATGWAVAEKYGGEDSKRPSLATQPIAAWAHCRCRCGCDARVVVPMLASGATLFLASPGNMSIVEPGLKPELRWSETSKRWQIKMVRDLFECFE